MTSTGCRVVRQSHSSSIRRWSGFSPSGAGPGGEVGSSTWMPSTTAEPVAPLGGAQDDPGHWCRTGTGSAAGAAPGCCPRSSGSSHRRTQGASNEEQGVGRRRPTVTGSNSGCAGRPRRRSSLRCGQSTVGTGDLVAVEVEDQQHGAVATRVRKVGSRPTRPGARLASPSAATDATTRSGWSNAHRPHGRVRTRARRPRGRSSASAR